MKLHSSFVQQLKEVADDKRILYPVIFLLMTCFMLLIEYIRLGEYIPVPEANFSDVLFSNRYFLLTAISIFLSSVVVLGIMFLKLVYLSIRRFFAKMRKKELEGTKDIVFWVIIVSFFLMLAAWFFQGYIKFTRGIGIWNQLWIFLIMAMNAVFLFRFKDNVLIFSKSVFSFLWSISAMFVLALVLLVLGYDRILYYPAAFLLIIGEIGIYLYVHTRIKSMLEPTGPI